MRSIIVVLLVVFLFAQQVSAFPSKELKELWDIPLYQIGYDIIKSYKQGNIQVEEIYYESRKYKENPVKIFAYYCYPAGKRNLPAILISHGGGGSANLRGTINWAKRGYAVLTLDLPGKGHQRWESRSSGPDMDVPILLRTTPKPELNYLVHAVAAVRNGITFLTQREEVDPNRIGMIGLSWGGVITLLTNGQDKRLKAAINVFGAGYIPEGSTWQDRFDVKSKKELEEWYSLIDPSNFLKTQHAPILFMTGTNDHCYYLPTFQKSYAEVTAPKKLVLIPNLRHRFMPYMQQIAWNWFDNKLKTGGSFPFVSVQSIFKKGDNKIIVPVVASAASSIKNATLYYAVGQPNRWTKLEWKSLESYLEDGIYYFGIPTKLVQPDMMFYVSIKDSKGSVASTPIRSIFKVRLREGEDTYAMSSPIQKINVHEPPLQVMGMNRVPEIIKLFFSEQNRSYELILPKKNS
ncbi:MAG: acetylxylan esterase [Candidatus Margulisbacteria bacterium]|nr:acetylxylan esterase [Candidatus Margulisiibacteriota bacterium]